jgi:hypothetical protein
MENNEWSALHRGSFAPGKELQYPLIRRLGGPQSEIWTVFGTDNLLPLRGFEPQTVQLYCLHYGGSFCWTLMCNVNTECVCYTMHVGFHLKVMKCTFTRGALYFVAEMSILYVVVSND